MEPHCCICGCSFAKMIRVKRNNRFAKQIKELFNIIISNNAATYFTCQQCRDIITNMYEFYLHVKGTQTLLLTSHEQKQVCRLCGCSYKNLTSLLHDSLPNQINDLFKIEVREDDTLSTVICEPCEEITNNNTKFCAEVRKVQKMYISDGNCANVDPQHYQEISNILDNLQFIHGIRDEESEGEHSESTLTASEEVLEINDKFVDDESMTIIDNIKEEDLSQEQPLHIDNPERINVCVENNHNSTLNEVMGYMTCDNNSCSIELSKIQDIKLWKLALNFSNIFLPNRCPKKQGNENGEDIFRCVCCNNTFKSTWEMLLHERHYFLDTHKDLRCKKCGRVFDTKHCLKSHKMLHRKLGGFDCDKCSKSFLFKSDLNNHLKGHTTEFSCTCPICELDFEDFVRLKEHGLLHGTKSRSKQYPYYCAICGRGYYSKRGASDHLSTHELRQDVSSMLL